MSPQGLKSVVACVCLDHEAAVQREVRQKEDTSPRNRWESTDGLMDGPLIHFLGGGNGCGWLEVDGCTFSWLVGWLVGYDGSMSFV